MPLRVGFVGSGMMAEALAGGFDASGVAAFSDMCCVDRNQPRLDLFASWGVTPCATATELAKKCDVIFIAVKPYGVAAVLEEMRPALSKDTLVVSIAAGVTIATMEAAAGEGVPIIRVMPNTPCLVKCVAAAMSAGRYCDQTHADTVSTLFDAVGKIHQVKESLLNAVTGVSGSGPAYVFQVIEAMADGGVLAGLPRVVAQDLAARTVMGAAKMVIETGKHPGALKDGVTSPGGTTIAAVAELERCGVRSAFMRAVKAAADRGEELSKQ
jgi:pyrroline-5-carboxylate reductase